MTRFVRPLSALVALLLAGGGIGLVLRSGDRDTYEVTAYFEKAIGLFPNSDVTILGVPVGKVTAVDPNGTRVEVKMIIEDRYRVPSDAFAQIVPISVIADRFVQLHPPYDTGPALADGAVLDLDQTQIPAELDDVFKQLKKLLEAIEPGEAGEPGALGDLIVELNEALRDRERDLKGTIVSTASLTGALADAQDELSQTLINLDDFFATLATRASSIGSLNRNLATVMGTLAESRGDIEATLANLADMTGEVGRLVERHRSRLGDDLELATNVLATILENRESVEESLQWLPVVAIGLSNAHHGGEFQDTDVRDSQNDLSCTPLDDLPDSPVKDALEEICEDATGAPPPEPRSTAGDESSPDLNCKRGVRKVRRQLDRLRAVDVPDELLEDSVEPLERKLRRLARQCKKYGDALIGEDGVLGEDGLVDRLMDALGDVPAVDDDAPVAPTAAAAAGAAVPSDRPSTWDSFSAWLGGLTNFVGWSW